MANEKLTPRIDVCVTIEGPAEEVLAALRFLKGGKRTVYFSVEVPRIHYLDADHHLPDIKDGQTHTAMRKIEMLAHQTIIDSDTEQRLARLIREAGEFTR
jgi:hypothetical protein